MQPMTGRESQDSDDLFRVVLLGGVAMLAVAAVLSKHMEWIRQLAIIVAWIHVKPFAELARAVPHVLSLAPAREWLFLPAILIDENLHVLLTDSGDQAFRFAVVASGRAAFVIYGPVFVWLAINSRAVRPDIAHRVIHDLASLLCLQAKYWPAARILKHAAQISDGNGHCNMKAKLIAKPISGASASETGSASELLPVTFRARQPSCMEIAIRPEAWLRLHGLARRVDSSERKSGLLCDSKSHGRLLDKEWAGLTGDAVCEVMESKIGAAWRGFEDLPCLHRSLAALFALFHDFRSEDGHALLSRLAVLSERNLKRTQTMNAAIATDRCLESEISAILASDSGKRLLAVANCHAWRITAFIGMLHAARQGKGVLASASFSWLKREDRSLWYALNSVGNAAAVVEAAGVYAHYRAERQIRRPLLRPAMYQASRAFIDTYLDMSPRRLAHRKLIAEFRKPVGSRLEEAARNSGHVAESIDLNSSRSRN